MTRTAITTKKGRGSTQAATTAPAHVFPAIRSADVLGRLAALQAAPIAALKQQWRDLYAKEPPPFSRT